MGYKELFQGPGEYNMVFGKYETITTYFMDKIFREKKLTNFVIPLP